MNNKRLKELDILRAIAFIFVVAQHTLGGFSNIKSISYLDFVTMKFVYVMAKTAVPIFLFISAVSLFYVYFNKFNWKNYYMKRIKYVLIPYIIWSAINMVMLGNEDRFKNFIVQLIAGNGAFHFWYMGTIIRLYLIFPIILWAAKKVYSMNIKVRASVFIGTIVMYYIVSVHQTTIADKISFFIFKNPTDLQHRIVNISILFWFLYFVMGIYFALNYEYLKKKVLEYRKSILIIYCMLFVYSYLNELDKIQFVRSLSLLYTVFSILAFYVLSDALVSNYKAYRGMKFISDYSFAAYMAHIMVINAVVNYIRLKFNNIDYLILGLLAWGITSVATPILFSLISYIPCSQYVTGVKGGWKKINIKLFLNIFNKKANKKLYDFTQKL